MKVATKTNALFLYTQNSARSVFGELLLDALGNDRFCELALVVCSMVKRI